VLRGQADYPVLRRVIYQAGKSPQVGA